MKRTHFLVFLLTLVLGFSGCSRASSEKSAPKVLVFSKTSGYRHASIEDGKQAITKLGAEHEFKVELTEDATWFTTQKLSQYDAVIFLSTTQDVLNSEQERAFEGYIQQGRGFVGVHAAADTEYEWAWYGKLVGGYFLSHPATQTADFKVVNSEFEASNFFPWKTWTRKDEIYNYKNLNPDVTVILTVDESSYEGGENGDYHPMAWYHEFDGGRAFYTGLGHTPESFTDELFLKHLLGGIEYALGR